MKTNRKLLALTIIPMSIASSCGSGTGNIRYPQAPQDSTADVYFGTEVRDPYRPLENDTAEATLQWVKAENDLTEAYLSEIPFRDNIRKRLTALNNYKKTGTPSRENDGNIYFSENDGLKNQSVIYRQTGDSTEVFLDPNTLSDDGTVALTGIFMSPDGKYTAYTISRSGSDWTEIYVMDTATRELLSDHIEWAKFTGVSWHDGGFFYSAYPRPEAGKEFSNANEYHSIYYHRLGTPQSDDTVAYENREQPLYFHSAYVPENQPYLLVSVGGQGIGDGLIFKKLGDKNAVWQTVQPSQDYLFNVVGVRDGLIYVLTTDGAENRRLITVPVDKPSRENWNVLVPEDKNSVLVDAEFSGKDKMMLTYDTAGTNHLYIYGRDGKRINEVGLPTLGSVSVSANGKTDDVYYSFSSFNFPPSIYSLDTANGKSSLFKSTDIEGFNPEDYVVEQVMYPSTDGTMIPMYLTYKKGVERDGKNPVYLYGYGGFNITLHPSFSPNRLLWLENGGIYAQAGLRGGAEYGEKWHEMGTKQNKLNVFNDFISAAEYMIREGWTTPELLTIEGGSNGGLLVGATVNLRPDLFKVAIPRVGVMDMMRYHLFTIGWNWASDYGTSADSPEMAQYLLKYSPVHNISNDGTPYPAIMVTTADHDDRVVPAHSFKYAATLQASDTGDAPKLIRIDSKAGHGSGKPVAKVIDEYTDIYSFIYHNLGISPEK